MSFFAMRTQDFPIIGMLAVSAIASRLCAAADSPLILWQDTPPNPEMVSQKGKGLTLPKGDTKIQWDVWGLPIGNGRLGGVCYGSVARDPAPGEFFPPDS